MEDTNSRLSFFFLGLGIGVAVGILFAPKSGQETRDMIRNKAEEGKDYIKRRGEEIRDQAGEVVDRSRGVFERQRDQFSAAIEAGRQAYRDAVGRSPESPAPLSDTNA